MWIASRGKRDDGPYESIIRVIRTGPSDVALDSDQLARMLTDSRHLDVTEILPMIVKTINDTQHTRSRRLVVLSGAETLDPASRELIWLLAPHLRRQGLSIVATGLVRSAPLFPGGDPIIVRTLTADECYDEIVRCTNVFPPLTVVERLKRATGGNARALRSVVSRLSAEQLEGTELLPHPLEMERSDAQYVISRGASQFGSGCVDAQITRVLAMFALHSESSERQPLPGVNDALLAQLHEGGWLQPSTTHIAPAEAAESLAAWNLLDVEDRAQLHRTFFQLSSGLHPNLLEFHRLYASDTMSADEACAIACGLFDSGSQALAQSATRALETAHTVPPRLAQRLVDHGLVQAALRAATAPARREDKEGRNAWRPVLAELAFLGLIPPLPLGPLGDGAESSVAAVATARASLLADNPEVARHVASHYRERQEVSKADADAPLSLLEAELALYDHADDAAARLLGVLNQRKHEGHARERFIDILHLVALGRLADAAELLSEAEAHADSAPSQFLALQGLARSTVAIARGRHREAPAPLAAFTLTMPMIGLGASTATAVLLRLRATLGRTDRFSRQLARVRRVDQRTGGSFSRSETLAAKGFSELLLHRTNSATRHLRQALQTGGVLVQGRLDVVADLLESLVAAGRSAEEITDAYRQYSAWVPDHLGDRAEALRARCELLASAPNRIHAAYRTAVAAISDHCGYEHARAQLVYGRLVQRYESPDEAVEIIRESSTAFRSLGLDGFVESARKVTSALSDRKESHLSPVEQEVLVLAKQGHTNQQIATKLFASKRTIESHLTQIFRTLNVSTKRELLEAT